jgi:hypothetical protein
MMPFSYREMLSLPADARIAGNNMAGRRHDRATLYWRSALGPALDKHLGRHIAGVAKESGGIEWSFDRKRGLEI